MIGRSDFRRSPTEPVFQYKQSDTVVARIIAGETLIVPVRGGVGDLASIYSLNELGSFLWGNLKTAKTAGELVELVLDEYRVESDVASRDVQAFLDEIKAAGLITQAGESSVAVQAAMETARAETR